MPTRIGAAFAAGLAVVGAWFVASSYLFLLYGQISPSLVDEPWMAWWMYTYNPDGWTKILLWVSALTPPAVIGMLALLVYRASTMGGTRRQFVRWPWQTGPRDVEIGVTNNHGHAEWGSMDLAKRIFPGPSPRHGGIVVGEAYRPDLDKSAGSYFDPRNRRTWGKGGKAPLLIDPCTDRSGHCILIAPAGGFKSTSLVSTIYEWTGSSVVLDVAGDLGPMLKPALEYSHGKAVHFLNPLRPDDAERWGFDALDWIKPDSQTFEEDVRTVVSWVFDGGKMNEDDIFFEPWAKMLMSCLVADLLSDDRPIAPRTLATLLAGITLPQDVLRLVLRGIYKNSQSIFARVIAGSLYGQTEKQFDGIYGTAVKASAWLGLPALGELVSGDAFKTDDIVNGSATVFVQIPIDTLDHSPGVARVIIGSLMKAVMRADGKADKVLFALDEVARLKRMAVIENARDMLRKSGVVLYLIYQSVGQIEEQWGQFGKRKWYANVSWRGYAGVRDFQTAKELSDECGQRGVQAHSEGANTGTQGKGLAAFAMSRSRGRNVNTHEIRRPVAFAHELLQELRADAMVVVGTGNRPLLVGLPIYFRRPELANKIGVSRFVEAA